METYLNVLEAVKSILEQSLSPTAYHLWISHIKPIELSESAAVLSVKTTFQKDILVNKYTHMLKKSFKEVLGFDVSIKVIAEDESKLSDQLADNPITENHLPTDQQKKLENLYIDAEYEYTFSTFIVGSSNTFAYAACKAVAQNQTGAYNPLFIYGPSGLGKTHLLMSISHEIKKKTPQAKIIYVNGESFTNEFITALEYETIRDFREKYRGVDFLLLDDVQFLSGKTQTQEEFFYTFNELHQAGKQIVLTSDRPPKDIKTLEDRLRTRFEWGLLADISPPEFETRVAIIRRKAQLLQIDIPDEVSFYIAKHLKNNIRQLEGAVKKIKAYKILTGSSPSPQMAQTVVRDILNDDQPPPVTVERIISEVASTYGVSEADIRSTKRQANISKARHIAIYIVREITQMSYEEIGKEFSDRDHSTITYSLKQAEVMLKEDLHQKEIADDIIKNIRD